METTLVVIFLTRNSAPRTSLRIDAGANGERVVRWLMALDELAGRRAISLVTFQSHWQRKPLCCLRLRCRHHRAALLNFCRFITVLPFVLEDRSERVHTECKRKSSFFASITEQRSSFPTSFGCNRVAPFQIASAGLTGPSVTDTVGNEGDSELRNLATKYTHAPSAFSSADLEKLGAAYLV